jgi:hypothetical protein
MSRTASGNRRNTLHSEIGHRDTRPERRHADLAPGGFVRE